MSLKVIKAGILDTIQDMGRYGYQQLGINPNGAMDKYAIQIANALVGNDLQEAVIELHFPASVFRFTQPTLIALSGADFSPSINGVPVPLHHCIAVNKKDELRFNKPVSGARAYIAVHGGLEIKEWLQSSSTNLKAGAGGFQGRNLYKNDELLLKSKNDIYYLLHDNDFKILPWFAGFAANEHSQEIFFLPGNEWEWLTEESKTIFTTTPFVITEQSDRMGYRLGNTPLSNLTNEEVISSAVGFGTIQLLPDGKLIVLMADHQTTGGYPRVAHVITAHQSRLAQMKTGDEIWFRLTDHQTAEELLVKQQQHLLQLQNACIFRLQEYLHANRY